MFRETGLMTVHGRKQQVEANLFYYIPSILSLPDINMCNFFPHFPPFHLRNMSYHFPHPRPFSWVCVIGHTTYVIVQVASATLNPRSFLAIMKAALCDILWCRISLIGIRQVWKCRESIVRERRHLGRNTLLSVCFKRLFVTVG